MTDEQKKQLAKERSKAFQRYNPVRYMFLSARARANKAGVPFTIDESDVRITPFCPVLGLPLSKDKGRDNTPSLDKINNAKGYTKGNVCVISMRANRLKSDMTEDEAEYILKYMKGNKDND